MNNYDDNGYQVDNNNSTTATTTTIVNYNSAAIDHQEFNHNLKIINIQYENLYI